MGRTGGEPPNLQISPDEYGGTARAPQGLARGTGCRVPGMVRSPHAADVMQPRVHFRVPDCIFVVKHPRASSRPEAPNDFSLRGEDGEFGDSRLAWNKWIQVQRLDGRRFAPSGVGSR